MYINILKNYFKKFNNLDEKTNLMTYLSFNYFFYSYNAKLKALEIFKR